ncbi:MAG: SPOR domain-containing protein [Porticoccaceae bacterium]|nr:SPOR domain-containing protein [Pseudomonadales bacterium]MCP5172021.1 SPOR domain-containing protein [Pseudomonadales bacterium]
MTRDYAKKPQKKRHKPRQPKDTPGWLWFLAGTLLGILVMTLGQLANVPDKAVKEAATAQQESHDSSPKPRFEFYTLLSESEVIVPDGPEGEEALREVQQDTVFLLQAGSFKNPRDADSLRARLILLNLKASIETFSPRSGETWHRVLVGPFDKNTQVASARAKLASNRIDSLLLKRKK